MVILTPTQPVGSGRPQGESNPVPPHQESCALLSYRAPRCFGCVAAFIYICIYTHTFQYRSCSLLPKGDKIQQSSSESSRICKSSRLLFSTLPVSNSYNTSSSFQILTYSRIWMSLIQKPITMFRTPLLKHTDLDLEETSKIF